MGLVAVNQWPEDCLMSEWDSFEKVVRAVESKLGIAYKHEGEQP